MQTAQHWVLPKEATSPTSARHHLLNSCAGLPRDVVEIAVLLTSELVTNAVKYGGERIVLTVRDDPDLFRVEVHDDGPRAPRVAAATSHAVGGRGLLLVDSLAHQWGTSAGPYGQDGKAVWFTLRKRP